MAVWTTQPRMADVAGVSDADRYIAMQSIERAFCGHGCSVRVYYPAGAAVSVPLRPRPSRPH